MTRKCLLRGTSLPLTNLSLYLKKKQKKKNNKKKKNGEHLAFFMLLPDFSKLCGLMQNYV